jgi:hypothetical protein
MGALSAPHIHGTDVPVEEPSTASTRDSCTATINSLFDDLVGTSEEGLWDVKAKYLGGFEVDNQFDFGGLLDRQIGGFFALKNPPRIEADDPKRFVEACAIKRHDWSLSIVRLDLSQTGRSAS